MLIVNLLAKGLQLTWHIHLKRKNKKSFLLGFGSNSLHSRFRGTHILTIRVCACLCCKKKQTKNTQNNNRYTKFKKNDVKNQFRSIT